MSNSISRVLCHRSNNFNNTCYVVGAVALKERGRYVRSYHIKGSVSSRLVCSFCIQKGNMGCDQWFTVSWHCSCRTYFCCFPFALSNIRPRPLVPFFQICLINSQLKTTYNIFRTLSDILSRNSYIMPFTRPYSLWNMRNYMYLWILKSYSVVSKKYSPHAVFQTLQTRKNDLSKTFRLTSLQKPKVQPEQSSVSLSICAFFCISCAIYLFSVLSGYFYVSLHLVAVFNVWMLINFVIRLL